MNPVRKSHPARRAGLKERFIPVMAIGTVTDAECTQEAIHRRADHIGPVMAGILQEMEEHSKENEHLAGLN